LLATLVAVTVCMPACAGAVYSPIELIVPTVMFPPPTPSTDHVTDALDNPSTVAVNCCVAPATTNATPGETDTNDVTVTTALAVLVRSAALVTVTV
jgi:hypothetical protein